MDYEKENAKYNSSPYQQDNSYTETQYKDNTSGGGYYY